MPLSFRLRPFEPLLLSFVLGSACGSPAQRASSTASPSPASSAPSPAPEPDAEPTVLTPEQRERDAVLAKEVAPFIDAYTNDRAVLLDGDRVVFGSTRDGIPALYLGDTRSPKAKPKKLDVPNERIATHSAAANGKYVLFASDVKSDGNFKIFRTDLEGSSPFVDLTPEPKLHRNRPIVARNVPDLFAFSAHSTTEAAARIFVQSALKGSTPREVYKDEKSGSAIDFSRDGQRILFQRFLSENEQVLFEINVKDGKATRVYPPDGVRMRVPDASYGADDATLFVAAQEEGKPSRVIALEPKARKEIARYEETANPNAGIDGIDAASKGDRIAIMVDLGDHSEVRILDAKTLARTVEVKTGLGAAFVGPFRPDGAAFSLTISRPETPADIFRVDARTGAVTPLREDVRPGLDAIAPMTSSIARIRAFDGLEIPLNLYLPASAASPARRPTIVLIHGGPSGSAYVRWNPTVRFFVTMGFAVVEPNIRGSSGFGLAFEKADDKEKRGDALKDVESVNRWARTQPFCDPERLVIMGGSYGGYMTLLALTRQPTLWRAGVDLYGMSNLITMEKNEDQEIREYDHTEFGILGKEDALLWEWSPLKDADKIVAPVFVFQGANDPVTPKAEADQIVRALRKRKIPVEYMLAPDEGHGIVRRDNRIAYHARVMRFLTDHLKLAAPK